MLILKQLRKKKNISQSDLAAIIGVSLRTIQLYEKENANIPIKNLNKIADYFEMGIDQLYAHEVNDAKGIYDISSMKDKKGHTIQKLGPGKYLLYTPLVMSGTQKKYLESLDDTEIVHALPRIGFLIEQVSVGNYLAFEVANGAMDNGLRDGIPQGSIVLGKRVPEKDLSKKLKENNAYWIIVCSTTIMCKEITAFDKKNKSITCHSLNDSPEYPDFEVPISEVLAFYQIIKKQVD